MLKFFKRKSEPPRTPSERPRPKPAARSITPPGEAAPLPEVSEGNLESDWALWEDSVAFQDSQMPSNFSELESVKVRTDPGTEDKPDPYAAVRSRRPK
jgi:hypothetical protein